MEEWKPVVGREGSYEVSSLGRLRSLDRVLAYGGRRRRGQLLSPWVDPEGRAHVDLPKDGARFRRLVHQVVLEAFVGPCPPGMEACHNNGDPTDNRLENLRWDTHSGNMWDQVRHGTHAGANKAHCPRGHLLELPNLVASRWALGHRVCLACARGRARVHYRGAGDVQVVADSYYRDIMR